MSAPRNIAIITNDAREIDFAFFENVFIPDPNEQSQYSVLKPFWEFYYQNKIGNHIKKSVIPDANLTCFDLSKYFSELRSKLHLPVPDVQNVKNILQKSDAILIFANKVEGAIKVCQKIQDLMQNDVVPPIFILAAYPRRDIHPNPAIRQQFFSSQLSLLLKKFNDINLPIQKDLLFYKQCVTEEQVDKTLIKVNVECLFKKNYYKEKILPFWQKLRARIDELVDNKVKNCSVLK